MASDRIEELRTRQFAVARRGGYEQAEVDDFLATLADWLETDEAKNELAQREISRVSDRTRGILAAAQESADETLAEARREAEAARGEANDFATATRATAEEEAAATRKAAEADATRTRAEADEHAKLTIREADERLSNAAREAEDRIASVDSEIAELAKKREQLIANLAQMASGLRATIDGPGSEDLGLPERTRTAAAFADPEPEPVPAEPGPGPVAEPPAEEHQLAEPTVAEDVEFVADEAETRIEPSTEAAGEETRPYKPDFDTDEELFDDARPPEPLPSGRDPQRRRPAPVDDPTTDEQRLNELL